MKDNKQVNLKARAILLLLVLELCAVGLAAQTKKKQARIVNGQITTISTLKYLLNLRVNGQFRCGASLVSTTHAVTAAHCVKGVPAGQVTVVGGASKLSETGVVRGVARLFIPSTYNTNSMTWDVAVLKLNSPMVGPNIQPIALCSQALQGGQNARISGWGLTSDNGNVSNDVRTAVIPLMAKSTCVNRYRGVSALTNTMLCASTSSRRDSCSGDSGGPLAVNGQLCGIVSWGIGCANPNYPGVYTNVNVVKQYILNSMAA